MSVNATIQRLHEMSEEISRLRARVAEVEAGYLRALILACAESPHRASPYHQGPPRSDEAPLFDCLRKKVMHYMAEAGLPLVVGPSRHPRRLFKATAADGG